MLIQLTLIEVDYDSNDQQTLANNGVVYINTEAIASINKYNNQTYTTVVTRSRTYEVLELPETIAAMFTDGALRRQRRIAL